MLKEQAKLFKRLCIGVDLLVILAAFLSAYAVRRNFSPPLFPLREYVWILMVVLPVWIYLLARHHLYGSIRQLSLFDLFTRLANVHLWGALIAASALYFFDRLAFSRSLFLIFLTLSFSLLTLEKGSARLALGHLRRRGFNFRNILIVGTRERALRFSHLLQEHADWGLRVLGLVQMDDQPMVLAVEGHQVMGYVRDLVDICKRQTVDEVVFCLPKDLFFDAEAYVRDLEELGITVRMVLDFYQIDRSKKELSFFHQDIPILTFHTKSLDAQQLLAKRGLDITGSLVGLAVTAVLFPWVALAIKLDSRGPLFFSQERIGEAGRAFRCWKFRTMQRDAEELRGALLACNEMNGAIFKIHNDPRVTRVGRFLRRTSLDEFPQFWNVLRGEMSLVGTRPPTAEEVCRYQNWQRRRISIRPGITGLWQVSGRSNINDFDEIVRLDLKYIDEWNLWLDLKILLKTLGVVLAGRGSC